MTRGTSGARRRGPSRVAAALAVTDCLAGTALLGRPGLIGRALAGAGGSAPPRWAARLLGGRLLVQGAANLARPGPGASRVSAAVEGAHAGSMLLVAAASDRYRRAAALSAVAAGAWSAAWAGSARSGGQR